MGTGSVWLWVSASLNATQTLKIHFGNPVKVLDSRNPSTQYPVPSFWIKVTKFVLRTTWCGHGWGW